jgi:hypothetical protein
MRIDNSSPPPDQIVLVDGNSPNFAWVNKAEILPKVGKRPIISPMEVIASSGFTPMSMMMGSRLQAFLAKISLW